MIANRYFFLLFFSTILLSCNINRKEEIIESVSFPSSIEPFLFGYDSQYKGINDKYKILVVYDSLVCSNCAINRLFMWNEIIDYLDTCDSASLVLIFSPSRSDYTDVVYSIKQNPICFPIYIDVDNNFIKTNNVPKGIFVCLLDSANNVLISGMPVGNETLWKRYKQIITNTKCAYNDTN